ncbi:MAG: DUF305 domain-containing protein, partial [Gemmatimonadaceae bacterium]
MRSPHVPRIALVLLAGIAGVSSAAAAATAQTASPLATAQPGEAAAIARARADSIRHPYTEADVHFMSGMIGHHAQAIVMGGWAPTHGASAQLRTLAARIINAQQDEIRTMQQW